MSVSENAVYVEWRASEFVSKLDSSCLRCNRTAFLALDASRSETVLFKVEPAVEVVVEPAVVSPLFLRGIRLYGEKKAFSSPSPVS